MKPSPKLRLFVPDSLEAEALISLSREQGHYLLHVMRASVGEDVAVFNGRDGLWTAEITVLGKKAATLAIQEQLRPQREESDLWLVFAPVKRQRIDLIVEKATELGASDLFPVRTRNTQMSRVRDERLDLIATEAAEQCERLSKPEIHAPQDLLSLLDRWPNDRCLLFLDEDGGQRSLIDALSCAKDRKLAVLVGPEGGFSQEERDILRKKAFALSVSLGPRILRADTAAIAALAAIQAISGDWRAPAASSSLS